MQTAAAAKQRQARSEEWSNDYSLICFAPPASLFLQQQQQQQQDTKKGMRLSCNGCRVLRKGCTEACTIRPCLQWIKSPDAQANATVFLAKFYGRAGLVNLINAAPESLRPAVFRSLLYEACGRIVNPIYGSIGLLWSANWHMCQAAVEAVLKGAPVVQISSEAAAAASPNPAHLLNAYDIRHVPKPASASLPDQSQSQPRLPQLQHHHKVAKAGRTRFKRTSSPTAARNSHRKSSSSSKQQQPRDEPDVVVEDQEVQDHQDEGASSHSHSHDDNQNQPEASLDTDAEAGSHVSQAEQSTGPAAHNVQEQQQQQQQLGLDLTLGFAPMPMPAPACATRPPADAGSAMSGDEPGVLGFRFL